MTCNSYKIVSSHKCLTYTNQISYVMGFKKVNILLSGEHFVTEKPCLVSFFRGRRAYFKARAILPPRLRTVILL